jgi:predicted ATP-dependent serine protease
MKQLQNKIDLVQINKVTYDSELFKEFKTGTAIDGLFSIKGGIPRATNWMLIGDPGVGKSTVALDVLSDVKASGGKVLFISAEMSRVDMYLYVERYPKFGDLDIFFTGEMEEGADSKKAIENLFAEGWDLILMDSFVEVQSDVKESTGMSTTQAEKWLLDLMYRHNLGNNKTKTYTSFIAIQQVNKGGNFVGSNKLKHMTTGMLEIRFEDVEDYESDRFMLFSKNRRGHVGKKLFFDLSAQGGVQYDTERFAKTEKMKELRKDELNRLKQDGEKFDEFFGTKVKEKPAPEPQPEDPLLHFISNTSAPALARWNNLSEAEQDKHRKWSNDATQETTRQRRYQKVVDSLFVDRH